MEMQTIALSLYSIGLVPLFDLNREEGATDLGRLRKSLFPSKLTLAPFFFGIREGASECLFSEFAASTLVEFDSERAAAKSGKRSCRCSASA